MSLKHCGMGTVELQSSTQNRIAAAPLGRSKMASIALAAEGGVIGPTVEGSSSRIPRGSIKGETRSR